MTPFNRYPDETPSQSIDQDDLIAFHLHELTRPQERALNRILQSNPPLALESAAIAQTLLAFPKNEPALPIDAALLDRNWQALRPSLTLHFPQPSTFRFLFRKWAIPALAASALAATALFLTLHHHQQPLTAVATIKAPSSTIPALSPSNTSPSSGINLAPSAPRPWTLNPTRSSSAPTPTDNHATSAPTETSIPNPSPTTRPSAPPTQPSSTQPSPTPIPGTASTVATITPSLATIPPPVSTARHTSPTLHHPHPVDLTLAVFGDFTASHTSTFTSGSGASLINESHVETASPSAGALASFHQQFRPRLGYRVTASYSRPTFEYDSKPISTTGQQYGFSGTTITDRNYELAGTYVVQGPRHRRLSTSIEAGAGVLAILSEDQYSSPTSNTRAYRAAAIAGIGSELALSKHWAIHAEYRAQLYKAPAIYHTSSSPLPTSTLTFTSNPILGLTYRFGTTGED